MLDHTAQARRARPADGRRWIALRPFVSKSIGRQQSQIREIYHCRFVIAVLDATTRLIIPIDLKLLKVTMPTTTPTILDQISAEKTKVSERLIRLDADRAKIATQLIDLETAERVLTRVGKTPPARRRRSASASEAKASNATRGRGRPPRAATSKSAGREPSARSLGLGERVLALATGKTRQELYAACPGDRPNHVGIAVQRHIRAGRIQERDGKLYATPTATEQAHATA